MRLTDKIKDSYWTNQKNCALDYVEQDNMVCGGKVLTKLGQLEDIEEELGIDLMTLFKAFKNGIWYKDQGGVHYHKQPYDTLEENIAYFRRLFEKQYTKNYGRTWALTKEELKNEQD